MTHSIPSLSAFCRSDPSVRFVSFTILATGVRAFECALNSLTSAFVYSRRTDFLAVFFVSFATYFSSICEGAYYHRYPEPQPSSASPVTLYSHKCNGRIKPLCAPLSPLPGEHRV